MAGRNYSNDGGYSVTIMACTHCGMPMNGPHLYVYCPGDPTALTRLKEHYEQRIEAVERRMDEIERMYGANRDERGS